MLYINGTKINNVTSNGTTAIRVYANGNLVFHNTYDILTVAHFTGSQYVDIGYNPNANSNIELTANLKSDGYNGFNLAANGGGVAIGKSGQQDFAIYTSASNQIWMGTNNKKVTYHLSSGSQTTDGVTKGTNSYAISSSSLPFIIGAMSNNYYGSTQYGNYISMDFYRLKIWEGGNWKYELYPARRKSDNVVGLYNNITNIFYVPSGTLTGE